MDTEQSKAFAAYLLNEDMQKAAAQAQGPQGAVTMSAPDPAPMPQAQAQAPAQAPAPMPVAAAPAPMPAPQVPVGEPPPGIAAPPPDAAPPPSSPPPPPLTSSAALAPQPFANTAQVQHQVRDATQEQKQGNQLLADAEIHDNAAKRDAAQATQTVDRRQLQGADELAAKQQSLAQENEAALNEEIAAHKANYARDPTKWWAHQSTQSRIGMIISMIGAGLGGKDPNKPLFDLVDRDVAEANRQDENLSRMGLLQQRKYSSGMNATRDRQAAMEARRAASLSIVQDELDARKLGTADDKTRGHLMAANAALDMTRADKMGQELHTRFGESLGAAQIKIHEDTLAQDRYKSELAYQAAIAKGNHSNEVKFVPMQDFEGRGVPSSVNGKILTESAASKDALYGLGQQMKVVQDAEKHGYLNIQTLSQLDLLKSEMEGTLRKYVGTGANLSPEEKANVDALSADVKGLTLEKLHAGLSLTQRIKTTQRFIAHHYANQVGVFGQPGENKPRQGTDVYNVLRDEEAEMHSSKEAQAKDKQDVDAVMMDERATPQAKALRIAALAHMGNKLAAQMAEESVNTQWDQNKAIAQGLSGG